MVSFLLAVRIKLFLVSPFNPHFTFSFKLFFDDIFFPPDYALDVKRLYIKETLLDKRKQNNEQLGHENETMTNKNSF